MTADELQHNILYSCTSERKRSGEAIVQDHVLSYIITGSITFYYNEGFLTYGPGSVGLLRKNLLLKSIKEPAANGSPFQSLNVFFDQNSLRKYSGQTDKIAHGLYTGDAVINMSQNAFLKGYFESVLPYFKSDMPLTATMAEIKTHEAIELVLRHNSRLKNMLFDFREPFKIDIEAFMGQNYLYNVPIAQFARLSGRSLATFKRDFKKSFNDTPERWIKKRRLERAHFLIKEQHRTPVSVFDEVGFESLSHFSDAFKKFFGYNASSIS
ncbi:AraC family transcriptional regulator [Pedobacter miscanthi]|uniref:helix-turn-helix domain-containing protein n=1 Tax=Pedobacter miscanthi TaxID=2259170 RepID=UPI00292E1158|nr:AraC family transcriptional regulator [Pedobacter miscanthi]